MNQHLICRNLLRRLLTSNPEVSVSWNYPPRDMQITCWYFERRRAGLEHFARLGFHTPAAACCGGESLGNPECWLEPPDATPDAAGIMYPTWQNKYRLLAPFGDLVTA